MQTTTTISLPKNLAQEVERQIDEGRFSSRSEFFRAAVRAYLLMQKGKLSWEVLATPFREYAQQNKLREKDILNFVEKGRSRGAASKNNK